MIQKSQIPWSSSLVLLDLFRRIKKVSDELTLHGFVYLLQHFNQSSTRYTFQQMDTAPGQPYSHELASDCISLVQKGHITEDSNIRLRKQTTFHQRDEFAEELLKEEQKLTGLAQIVFTAKLLSPQETPTNSQLIRDRKQISEYLCIDSGLYDQYCNLLGALENKKKQ